MMSEKTKKTLEKRYYCRISIEHIAGLIKVYSLDGCPWDKVGNYRALVKMLKADKESLKKIARG